MSKKNQYQFRNDLIKEYTPEQVKEFIREKSILENLDVENAYARIMILIMQFSVYGGQLREFTEKRGEQFVIELARVREEMKDGFTCYSMLERVGSVVSQKFYYLFENRAIFGVLLYNMAKYILKGGYEQEFTLKVMKTLTSLNSWQLNEYEKSYAVNNFFGKAVEIYNIEFVKWIMNTFDINAYTNFKGKEFVSLFANLYISLEKTFREDPKKIALLVKDNENSL